MARCCRKSAMMHMGRFVSGWPTPPAVAAPSSSRTRPSPASRARTAAGPSAPAAGHSAPVRCCWRPAPTPRALPLVPPADRAGRQLPDRDAPALLRSRGDKHHAREPHLREHDEHRQLLAPFAGQQVDLRRSRALLSARSDQTSDAKAGAILQEAMLRIFPQLQGVGIDYCWGGMVDMTPTDIRASGRRTASGMRWAIQAMARSSRPTWATASPSRCWD